jgi:hypothetical protein
MIEWEKADVGSSVCRVSYALTRSASLHTWHPQHLYSLRPIILFANTDVSITKMCLDTSTFAKSIMGRREYYFKRRKVFRIPPQERSVRQNNVTFDRTYRSQPNGPSPTKMIQTEWSKTLHNWPTKSNSNYRSKNDTDPKIRLLPSTGNKTHIQKSRRFYLQIQKSNSNYRSKNHAASKNKQ